MSLTIANESHFLRSLGFQQVPSQRANTEIFHLTICDVEKIHRVQQVLWTYIQTNNLQYTGTQEEFFSNIRQNVYLVKNSEQVCLVTDPIDPLTRSFVKRLNAATVKLYEMEQQTNQEGITETKYELAVIAYEIGESCQSEIYYQKALSLFQDVIQRKDNHPSFSEKDKVFKACIKVAEYYQERLCNELQANFYFQQALTIGEDLVRQSLQHSERPLR
ncbi:hypothetical protein [Simkania sp.]|uniref:hypothetical protein n=1 Tax=Simkania sp. TaxID=34094 RepID=UPI003B5293EF